MMLIERAEQLKRELTDQWVIVKEDVPELRRFAGLTGQVKTVNMNCRVLVQFDNPVDISWYDIDPDYLTVVDEPLPKKAPEKEDKKKDAPKAKAAPKKAAGGMSPLEAARAQGAGGADAKPASKPAGGMSPLEMARQQGAGGSDDKTEAPAAQGDKKLSPLELARQQGAGGAAPTQEEAPAEQESAEEETAEAAPEVEETPPAEEKDSSEEDTSGLSPLELARKQGPFKG